MCSIYEITFEQRNLHKDYAGQKNHLTSMCKGEYIINIDADELPDNKLLKYLKRIIKANKGVELISVPRVNIVEGLTQRHIYKWGWFVNNEGWINWPDYQPRIFKNDPENIQYGNKLHESVKGAKTVVKIQANPIIALWHIKSVHKQAKNGWTKIRKKYHK